MWRWLMVFMPSLKVRDEIDRIAEEVKSRTKALQLVELDKSIVRFYLPIKTKDPEKERTWYVIRTLSEIKSDSNLPISFVK
ncbi:MAG: hypothetical protein SCH70_12540 [Candidatus Methanoperedens sp.]|nr:hypothetical protein [Candidatus Methanoperedens sp.]